MLRLTARINDLFLDVFFRYLEECLQKFNKQGQVMTRKDGLLALLVVVVWGLNFVVIKVGLHNMPPLMLAGLRFLLVAFPALFFVARPKIPFRLLLGYGLTISFGQFAFLFCAINFGMPAGLASLVLQAQAFFTIILGALVFGERLQGKQLVGIALAVVGVLVLAEASLNGQHVALLGFLLTLAAAFCWASGNIFNKKIMQLETRPAVMSLVVWSALIPIVPFMVASYLLDGPTVMLHSLVTLDLTTILSLIYLAFVATIVGYGIWGALLGRYETWRVAPLSLLVPVVGIASAALLLDEKLGALQLVGALLVMAGLYINVFGLRLRRATRVRG
nr:EamA-like transporter family [uncultured bacterium]